MMCVGATLKSPALSWPGHLVAVYFNSSSQSANRTAPGYVTRHIIQAGAFFYPLLGATKVAFLTISFGSSVAELYEAGVVFPERHARCIVPALPGKQQLLVAAGVCHDIREF